MRHIIDAIVDRESDGTSSFFEIGRQWGKSIIGGLARFDGWPVALFAEDPYIYGGAWTASSSQKVTRLIDLASTFHLPLVHLVDCPGFLIGLQAEQDATIRHGSHALAALGECTTPFCSVVIRRRSACRRGQQQGRSFHYRYAGRRAIGARCRSRAASRWPTRQAGRGARPGRPPGRHQGPAEQGALAFRTAEAFDIEEIIDRDTRPLLCKWAGLRHGPARQPPAAPYRP
jgi:hypothetical protein